MSVVHKYEYEELEPIPQEIGYGIIVFTVIFFQIVNQIVQRYGRSPTTDENTWKWRNLFVSWIHACIVGTWDLSCFYFYPELVTDLIAFHNLYLYSMVAFSTGYFVHDFIDIVVNKKLADMWEVIPHHFAVAGMFFYNVVTSRCIAYNVVALLAEVNTIFLHARKLLQMARVPYNHILYRANAGVNLITFVLCRFGGLAWIIIGMFIWGNRVTPLYYYVLAVAMFVMWVTNIMLFRRLVLSDLIRPFQGGGSTQSTRKSSTDMNPHENNCTVLNGGSPTIFDNGLEKVGNNNVNGDLSETRHR